MRGELLTVEVFDTLLQAQVPVAAWRDDRAAEPAELS
jgi:hypothetical protein